MVGKVLLSEEEADLPLRHEDFADDVFVNRRFREPIGQAEQVEGAIAADEPDDFDDAAVQIVPPRRNALEIAQRLQGAAAGARPLIMERCHGPFERRVLLPTPIDPQHIEADYKDGILFVRILKQREP